MNEKIFKRCFIHIGTEKTGSTAIQKFLERNRDLLLSKGVIYPNSLVPSESQFDWVLACVNADQAWSRGADLAKKLGVESRQDWFYFQAKMQTNFKDQFYKADSPEILIISSEHFHSRLHYREEVQRLKEMLIPYCHDLKVIIYLRRQDRLAISRYSTIIKDSGVADSITNVPDHDSYYNYLRLYSMWSEVFGEKNLIIRIYDEARCLEGGVVNDFSRVTGLERFDLQTKSTYLANPSLSRLGLDFLRAIRELGGGHVWATRKAEIVTYAEKRWSGKADHITRNQAIAFYNKFRARNDQLASKIGRSSLFDLDFSEYPETLSMNSSEYYEAIEFAAENFIHLVNRTPENELICNSLKRLPSVIWHTPQGQISLLTSLATMTVGKTVTIKVKVENTGMDCWSSEGEMPVNLSYHWLLPDGKIFIFDGLRTKLSKDGLKPGNHLTLDMIVSAPNTHGLYVLEITLVSENRFWFEQCSDQFFTARCNVDVSNQLD